MHALETLGLRLKEEIPVQTLLGENFNPGLYGLTESQRRKIAALRDIVAEYNSKSVTLPYRITCSRDAATLISGTLSSLSHEEVWIAFMNSNADVVSMDMLFMGGISSSAISVRDIVAKALSNNATALILYHNHPSGNPYPSTDDVKQTEKLRNALKVFDIGLVDHVIIAKDKYYSFANEGISSLNTDTTKKR